MSSDRDDRRGGAAAGSVALFIDWDNFAIGLRQEMPDRAADVGPILRWTRRFGPLALCRAYGEWREPAERLAIYNAGVEVVYSPVLPLGGSLTARNGGGAKSLADTAMAVDVTELLSLIPSVGTLVMVTSDKDLIPVLRFAQRRGLRAIIVGSDRTAAALRELADDFISYRQLLESETGATAPALSRPATIPPLRYPRTTRITPAPSTTPSPTTRRREVSEIGPTAATRALPSPVAVPDSGTAPTAAASQPAASAGSVFPDGADEPPAEAADGGAARRRRRGGRRRRAGDVALTGQPEATGEEEDAEEGETSPPAAAAAEETSPARLAAEDRAPTPPLSEVPAPARREPVPAPSEPARRFEPAPGFGAVATGTRSGSAFTPPVAAAASQTAPRAPVVLPGERLRKLANVAPVAPPMSGAPAAAERLGGAGAPIVTPTAGAAAAPAETAAPVESETAAPPAGEEETPAARSTGRSRGRRGGRSSRGAGAKESTAAATASAPPSAAAAPKTAAAKTERSRGGRSGGAKTAAKSAAKTAAPAESLAAAPAAAGTAPTGEPAAARSSGRSRGRRGGRSK